MLGFGRLVSFIVLLAFVTSTTPALAKCWDISDAPLDADCVVMPYGEQRGVWFSLDRADEIRRMKLKQPELELQISELEKITELRDQQVKKLTQANEAQVRATDELKGVNVLLVKEKNQAERNLEKEIAKRKAWYRSPYFWFGTGVVTTLLAGAGLVYLVK